MHETSLLRIKVRSQKGLNGLEFGLLQQLKEAMSFIRRQAVDDLRRVEVNQPISVQNELQRVNFMARTDMNGCQGLGSETVLGHGSTSVKARGRCRA